MSSAAELRQILKEDANGQNLYDHLTQTLMQILIDRPKNAYDAFELISANVKSTPLNPDPSAGRQLPTSAEQLSMQLEWTKKCASLLKVPDEPPEDSGVKVQDLMDEMNLLEWSGVSFGKGEIYRLYLSMKKLAEILPGDVERLRFVGRFNTRTQPYYVVEGVSPEEEEGIDETKQESKAGGNKYAYWVIQSVESGQWLRLPNVTMEQVVKVRMFKRLLTGNLEAHVPSYPPFPGKEKNLLRAIIACIVGETSISPDGYFELDDSDPPVVKSAEAEQLNERFPKASSELKEPDAWKHHEVELNKIGRVLAMPEQTDESGEPITPEEPVDVNPPLDAIKSEQWTFRVAPGGAGTTGNSVVVGRSLKWPGAVAIAAGRKYVNIYVGNGLPYNPNPYSPPLPPSVQSEWSSVGADGAPGPGLVEQNDVKVDPTPPVPEGEAEE